MIGDTRGGKELFPFVRSRLLWVKNPKLNAYARELHVWWIFLVSDTPGNGVALTGRVLRSDWSKNDFCLFKKLNPLFKKLGRTLILNG